MFATFVTLRRHEGQESKQQRKQQRQNKGQTE